MAKQKKRGSHVYGWLQLPRVTKVPIQCRARKHCSAGGLIQIGERYVSIARWRMPYRQFGGRPDDEVRSYDEGPVVSVRPAVVIPTRLHFECLVGYLNFMADRQEEYVKGHPSKGRPVGAGELAVLSPEQAKYRRSLVRRRAYLTSLLLKEQDSFVQLSLVRQFRANREAIDASGAAYQSSLSRRSNESRQTLEAALRANSCRGGEKTHVLTEEDRCEDCNKQYPL